MNDYQSSFAGGARKVFYDIKTHKITMIFENIELLLDRTQARSLIELLNDSIHQEAKNRSQEDLVDAAISILEEFRNELNSSSKKIQEFADIVEKLLNLQRNK